MIFWAFPRCMAVVAAKAALAKSPKGLAFIGSSKYEVAITRQPTPPRRYCSA